MGVFGWISGFEVHRRCGGFIKGENSIGPLKMRAPQVGTAWFWFRVRDVSTKIVEEHGPDWWRKKVLGVRLGVLLIFAAWLVPSFWMIGSGIYGIQQRIFANAEAGRIKPVPSLPAPVPPENGGHK